ncbi:MAG: hypothetical protein JW708_00995 [Vallitaleaceae bacterium]|nr:hypothetical protein [Vallitaleaceae bacterium]
MKLFAHRGASREYPENTLLAFREAMKAGAKFFELDIHLTKDEVFVVCHDDKINRVSNGDVEITRNHYDDLKKYDFGRGEQLPTLEQVLDLFEAHMTVNVEIKNIGEITRVHSLREILKRYNHLSFIISSFDHGYVYAMEEIDVKNQFKYGLLFEKGQIEREINLFGIMSHIDYLHLPYIDVNQEILRRVNNLGMQVNVYTVDDLKILKKLQNLGVFGVFTNRPELVAKIEA